MDASELLAPFRIVPVVVIEDPATAVPLAKALCEGGLYCVEITLRTDAALVAIERVARDVPDAVVGAGSTRLALHVRQAGEAGASFCVSPGSSDELLDAARDSDMPLVPGAQTATEMMRLAERGYTLQKFFPAELSGGVAFLRSVGAPLPAIRYFPTGGITPDKAADYLALDSVRSVGGTWIAPQALLASGDYKAITKLARDAAQLAL